MLHMEALNAFGCHILVLWCFSRASQQASAMDPRQGWENQKISDTVASSTHPNLNHGRLGDHQSGMAM